MQIRDVRGGPVCPCAWLSVTWPFLWRFIGGEQKTVRAQFGKRPVIGESWESVAGSAASLSALMKAGQFGTFCSQTETSHPLVPLQVYPQACSLGHGGGLGSIKGEVHCGFCGGLLTGQDDAQLYPKSRHHLPSPSSLHSPTCPPPSPPTFTCAFVPGRQVNRTPRCLAHKGRGVVRRSFDRIQASSHTGTLALFHLGFCVPPRPHPHNGVTYKARRARMDGLPVSRCKRFEREFEAGQGGPQ
uniref:C2H2-type domain-containing protein n=1 Tax=Knipowitschia caucasica TaxID=637954 RepID=A0AAV2JKY8_KNICA